MSEQNSSLSAGEQKRSSVFSRFKVPTHSLARIGAACLIAASAILPAGTGLARYNDIEVEPSAQATAERMQALDTFGGYQSAFQMDNEVYTYGNGGFMAVSLDEYGRGLD